MPKRLPAEWEPQSAMLLTWPRAETGWADMPAIEHRYIELIIALSRAQDVIVILPQDVIGMSIMGAVVMHDGVAANVHCITLPTDDIWIRDYGPLCTVADGQIQMQNFRYNGWGNKYPANLDNGITPQLKRSRIFENFDMQNHALVLEGGAIESNGNGTLMTTRSVWQARHPELDDAQIADLLTQTLGAQHILILENGALVGDDTDGHIDTLARFVTHDTILYQDCDNPQDANYAGLHAMGKELRAAKQRDGSPWKCIALPSPAPVFNADGRQLPAGYANFIIANNTIIMPSFADPADELAEQIFKQTFPGYQLYAINARLFIEQNGSLHCACMQIPAVMNA